MEGFHVHSEQLKVGLMDLGLKNPSMVFSNFELKSSKSPPNLILMKSIFGSRVIGFKRFFYRFQKVNTYGDICKADGWDMSNDMGRG